MQKNSPNKVTALAAALILLILASSLPTYATIGTPVASSSTNDTAIITKHKMSTAELQQYQNAAGTHEKEQNYNKLVGGYGTGLSPPTANEWARIAENAYVVDKITYSSLPLAVDLSASEWFPPIGNQGQQGSCASFAIGYYCKTYQEAKEHGWNLAGAQWTGGSADGNISLGYQNRVMSPAFVYNLVNGGVDEGSGFETPIRLVCNVGISSWQNMPYYWQDYQRWPTEAAWTEAPLYRSNSTYNYQYLYADSEVGVTSLKSWLAAGNLAVVAVDAKDSLYPLKTSSTQDLLTTDNYVNGALDHAATIVGYDDNFSYIENGTSHNGAFKIANTWGKGSWENIPDGCYWISYAAMKELSEAGNPVILFENLEGYQPQILAIFNLTHQVRSDCKITFGLGTPSAPLAIKNFNDHISGGTLPFCQNNIVFDLTEFKEELTSLYNQAFFMTVYDSGIHNGGTPATGTINYFSIADAKSTLTPTITVNGQQVNLTLTCSFAPTTVNVFPTSGPPGGAITLKGIGLVGNSVNISYLNPTTHAWIPLAKDYAIASENFSCAIVAPDFLQNNPLGDNQLLYDDIIFRVQDNGSGASYNTTAPYRAYRRGIAQIGNMTAAGLLGNGTDLSSALFVRNGQSINVWGKWFSPGTATLSWDGTASLGTATVDQSGTFSANIQVPPTTAGPHNLIVNNNGYVFCINLTRLPTVTIDYDDQWHTADFTVALNPDYTGIETYYRVNDGEVCTVSANGQPSIFSEGSNNVLEYWSTWNIYGTGSMAVGGSTVAGIKLDKTSPLAVMWLNGGSATTNSRDVTLTVTAVDWISGIHQMRISNNAEWNQATWESYSTDRSWRLSSGDGNKTVYCQIQDYAGQTTTVAASIELNSNQAPPTPTATPNASPTVSPTPVVPEYNAVTAISLLTLLTAITLFYKRKSSIHR